jgi:DNA-binding MarR family transcriptional regulator
MPGKKSKIEDIMLPVFHDSENCYTPLRWEYTAMEWRQLIRSPYCDLTPARKLVLNCLADYGKKYGEDIFPSQQEIAFRAQVSTTWVHETVKLAEQQGWIIRLFMQIGGGRKRTIYTLTIPLGVSDATALMKKRFWQPPYKYGLKRVKYENAPEKDTVKLVRRTDLSST